MLSPPLQILMSHLELSRGQQLEELRNGKEQVSNIGGARQVERIFIQQGFEEMRWVGHLVTFGTASRKQRVHSSVLQQSGSQPARGPTVRTRAARHQLSRQHFIYCRPALCQSV